MSDGTIDDHTLAQIAKSFRQVGGIALSARDHFAMAALQGMLANGWMTDQRSFDAASPMFRSAMDDMAREAYIAADAMLKERTK